MANRRTAQYIATLVYADEPQLILLRAFKTNIVAMAIPSNPGEAQFLATSVTAKNWLAYMDGHVDLRYLFAYAEVRTAYRFDLMKMKDQKITMKPWEGPLTEDVLPGSRFFSSNHTEDDLEDGNDASDSETLYVDGEWDMPDFGSFYSRYSDVYYFLSSATEYDDDGTPPQLKAQIEDAFRDKAFKGGFSYVHFYEALAGNRARSQRLGVDKIKYESPGYINVNGEKETFQETKSAITNFIRNKTAAKEIYNKIYQYMSKARLLVMEGGNYDNNNIHNDYVRAKTEELSEIIGIPNIDAINVLVENNTLVFAKVVMSFYRRLDEASKFFAQGRVNFA